MIDQKSWRYDRHSSTAAPITTRIALSDPSIGDHAAEHRREVDETGVEAENLRRERLRGERADDRFHRRTEPRKSSDVLDMSWQQQLVHHVKGEQRRHSIDRRIVPIASVKAR